MMLEFRNLNLRAGDFQLSANDKIEAGQIIAVIGPSGCGKSTLLNAIAGFAQIESGQILWNGKEIQNLSPSKRLISMVFQDHNLFPRMNIRDNILLGTDSISSDVLNELCEKLGICEILERYPRSISGGQAARAAIARAILQNNDIWLLDEPLAALGPRQNREIRALIKENVLRINKIALMVSHNPDEMIGFADKIIWIGNGNVNAAISADDFFQNPPDLAAKYL